MNKFDEIKKEIEKLTKNSISEIEHSHSLSVLKWTIKLKPDADISLKIAALGHDIDRSFPEKRIKSEDFDNYADYKRAHSKKSAEIISELMTKFNLDNKIIEKTRFLIENHEIGGEGDVEILKEADSLSFFENNLLDYKKKNPRYFEDKIVFMYKRLSKKAREMILKIKFQNDELKRVFMDTIEKQI